VAFDLSQYTQAAKIKDSWTAAALRTIEEAINRLAKGTGVDAVGEVKPPPQVDELSIKSSGELIHATITDNSALTRNINYFLEHDTSPDFTAPHVIHLGTSRGTTLSLPTNDDTGALQSHYFRAFSQYPGSKPSKPQNYVSTAVQAPRPPGSTTAPASPVNLTGSTNMTLLPSTGSGTADSNGQRGGYGFGKFLNRAAPGPKRAVGNK
jgi:hypothetical protein